VVGFDDIEQAAWPAYDLSTIRQDIDQQSELALELLAARFAAPGRPFQTCHVTLTAVLRSTTRAPG
jgi:DNA-binding LacI/PurR family transcriptional regulator